MRRKYFIIIGIVLAITAITVSFLQWNKEVETTTEKAKKEIQIAEKEAQKETGDAAKSSGSKGEVRNQDGTEASNGSTSTSQDATTAPDNGPAQATDPNQPISNPAESTTGSLNGGVGVQGNTGVSPFKGTSLNDIKSAYRTIFSDLEIQEMSRVDQLMVQAKADYVSGKLTKSDLTVKYQDAAVALERNADQTFNTVYNQLQIDLEKYGHSPSEAVEFRSEYQTKKQERLTHVINELQNF